MMEHFNLGFGGEQMQTFVNAMAQNMAGPGTPGRII